MNDGDGEVDENFWAQAAADQAANRDHEDDGDDGAPFLLFSSFLAQKFLAQVERRPLSTHNSSKTTILAVGSTMTAVTTVKEEA